MGLINSITRKWLESGAKRVPEEMIDYIMSLITLFSCHDLIQRGRITRCTNHRSVKKAGSLGYRSLLSAFLILYHIGSVILSEDIRSIFPLTKKDSPCIQ